MEGAAFEEIQAARAAGVSRVIRYGISDEQAWDVGLACGGTIDVLVEAVVGPELAAAGADVERGRAERARAGQQPHDQRGTRDGEREAGHEEEPTRRVEEEEAQVAPAVAPRPEVRRP